MHALAPKFNMCHLILTTALFEVFCHPQATTCHSRLFTKFEVFISNRCESNTQYRKWCDLG